MRSLTRDRVSSNMEYHQQLADHYKELVASREGEVREPAAATTAADSDPTLPEDFDETMYLAELHAEVARQLREVLGVGAAPVISDMISPVSRSDVAANIASRATRASRVN